MSFASGLASAVGYFLFPSLDRDEMAAIVAAACGVGILAYYYAALIHAREVQNSPAYDATLLNQSNSSSA